MDLTYTPSSGPQTQLGFVVLQSDETLEHDMRRLLPDAVEMLVSRVASAEELSAGSIAEMESRLTGAAALLPRGADVAAVGYGCTSASAQLGMGQVARLIRQGVPTPHVTDPVSALLAACAALGVSRIAMISPYVADVSAKLRAVLEKGGVRTTAFASFNEPSEERVVRISAQSLYDAALNVTRDDPCDAVFLSCTNLRTLDIIDDIEKAIGKPALSSNQVLAWHMLQLAGVAASGTGPGTLWRG